ncbi:hypothetical protein WMF30_15905 [Sorangium sp. So ce134]
MRRRSIRVVVELCGLLAAHAIASGCGTLVKLGENNVADGGGGSEPGTGDEGSEPGTGGGGSEPGAGGGGSGPVGSQAIALLRRQLPDPTGTGGGSSAASGGPVLDPDDLFVRIGNRELSCADPYGDFACGTWEVSIGIPPALQVPGVLNLDAPELISYQSFAGPDRGGGDCYGGGGSFIEGTIEIVSIDAAQVVVRLSDTDTYEFDANGEHTALRCP